MLFQVVCFILPHNPCKPHRRDRVGLGTAAEQGIEAYSIKFITLSKPKHHQHSVDLGMISLHFPFCFFPCPQEGTPPMKSQFVVAVFWSKLQLPATHHWVTDPFRSLHPWSSPCSCTLLFSFLPITHSWLWRAFLSPVVPITLSLFLSPWPISRKAESCQNRNVKHSLAFSTPAAVPAVHRAKPPAKLSSALRCSEDSQVLQPSILFWFFWQKHQKIALRWLLFGVACWGCHRDILLLSMGW